MSWQPLAFSCVGIWFEQYIHYRHVYDAHVYLTTAVRGQTTVAVGPVLRSTQHMLGHFGYVSFQAIVRQLKIKKQIDNKDMPYWTTNYQALATC